MEDQTNKFELDPLATPDYGSHVRRKKDDIKEQIENNENIAVRTPFQRDKHYELKIRITIPYLEDITVNNKYPPRNNLVLAAE